MNEPVKLSGEDPPGELPQARRYPRPRLATSQNGRLTFQAQMRLVIVDRDIERLRCLESDFSSQEIFKCAVTTCLSLEDAMTTLNNEGATAVLMADDPFLFVAEDGTFGTLGDVGQIAPVIVIGPNVTAERRQYLLDIGCSDAVWAEALNENDIEMISLIALQAARMFGRIKK